MKVITIGRGHDNDYVINSPEVSRYNTQIVKADDGFFTILDMGSSNGTYVNGKRISGEQQLSSNDTVIVGNVAIDWKGLFMENPQGVAPKPVARKTNWVLLVVLGAVSLGLVVGIVYMMLLFMKYKKEDARKIDALEKAHYEYKDDAQLDSNLTEIKLQAYQEALETAKSETEAEKNKKTQMEKTARKNEEEAAARIAQAEKMNQQLQQEIDDVKSMMARELEAKEGSLQDAEKAKETLLKELEAEQKKVKDMKAAYESILEVYEALEDAPLEDICKQLRYEYSDSLPPRVVLYEKIKNGEGDLILALAKRLKSKN